MSHFGLLILIWFGSAEESSAAGSLLPLHCAKKKGNTLQTGEMNLASGMSELGVKEDAGGLTSQGWTRGLGETRAFFGFDRGYRAAAKGKFIAIFDAKAGKFCAKRRVFRAPRKWCFAS